MKRLLPALVVLVLLIFVYLPKPLPTQAGDITVSFCPVCEAEYLAILNGSDDIACAFYELTHDGVIDVLAAKDARVLVYEENHEGYGEPVRSRGLMHDKFCILDGERVLTGSANPTMNGLARNDNNVVVIEGRVLVENYRDEWAELRAGGRGRTRTTELTHTLGNRTFIIENYFCPEDGCEEEILEEIAAAEESVRFLTFSFTSDAIGDLLVEKAREGVAVTGVFEKRGSSQYSEYGKLSHAGLDVRYDGNPATMHHKLFIVDGRTVITGSMNPTANGDERNDENILILHDRTLAQAFSDEFSRVWGLAETP